MRLAARFLTFLSAALLMLVVACGGSSSSAPPAPEAPVITSFTADKTTISQGDVAFLTAVYSNGTGTLSPGGSIPNNQAIAVQPQTTTTYVLTVTNSANATVTRAVTITVAPPITGVTFTASKSVIGSGESVQLTATFSSGTAAITNNLDTKSITPVSGVPVIVTPSATTIYTLTVTNAAGVKATQGLIVTVQDVASISSFTATPLVITQGSSAILSYTFTGGTGSINNGIGPVTSGLTTAVTPAVTTTYVLTVTNATGIPAVAALTVVVSGHPSDVSLIAEHSTITVGQSVRLTPTFTSGTAVITNTSDATTINPVNGVPVTVTPSQTTSYILTVTNTAGMSICAVATVSVVPLPTIISFSPASSTITKGDGTSLLPLFKDGTGSINNGIGPVQPGVPVPISPVVTTPYILTVTNATGDFIQKSTTVTVVDAPTGISLAAIPPIITIGNSARLIGNFSAGTAVIDNGVGSVLNGVPYVVTPPVTTTYTMTVINPAGASATTGTVVTVVPPPHITAFTSNPATPPPVNSGSNVQLLPVFEDGQGYIGGVGSVISGNSYVVNPIETTTYTLTVTNPAGDSITRILTVHVVGDPVIQSFTANPVTITAGDTSQLIGIFSGGNGVVTGPADPSSGMTSNPANITSGVSLFVHPTQTTTYTLTVMNTAGVSVNRSVTVLVVGAPSGLTLTANPDHITAGQTTYLTPTWITAIGGTSGTITPSVGSVVSGSAYAVQPTQTTTYTLTVSNSIGATTSVVCTVPVLTGPNSAALVAKPEGITVGKSSYLTAYFTIGTGGSATVDTTAAPGYTAAELPVTYPAPGTLQNAVPFPVTPTAPGTYVYTLTTTNSDSVTSTYGATVNVYAAPTANLAVTPTFKNPITLGETTSITPTFTGGTGVIAGIGPVTSGQAYPVTPGTTTTYVLTVTNPVGDTATFSLTITVVSNPVIDSFTATPSSITAGSSSQLIGVFTGGTGVITGGALPVGGTTVNSGEALPVSPAADTTYTLTVTNAAGGTAVRSVTVTVQTMPVATGLVAAPATPVTVGTTVYLTPTFSGGAGVIAPGIGAVSTGLSYAVNPTETTTYTLTVTNSTGTTAQAICTVVVLTGPNAAALVAKSPAVTANKTTYLTGYFTLGTGGAATITGPANSFTGAELPMTTTAPGTLLNAVPFPVTPSAAGTYVYTMEVTNGAGASSTYGTTLTVYDAPTATLGLTAGAKNPIQVGDSTSITPVFTGGTGTIAGIGPVANGQAYPVSPSVTTTYVLTVTNEAGDSTSSSFTITVYAGPMASQFYFQPSTIAEGGTSQLYAVFSNATSADVTSTATALQLNPISYTPVSGAPQAVAALASSAGTYTYTLTATNSTPTPAVSYSTTANLTVVPAPTATLGVTYPAAAPYIITAGDSAQLVPAFTGGTAVINGLGSVTTGVTYYVTPTVSTTYTLTVTSPAGVQVTDTVTIIVVSGPYADSLVPSKNIVTTGDTYTLTPYFKTGLGLTAQITGTAALGAVNNAQAYLRTAGGAGTESWTLTVSNGIAAQDQSTGTVVTVVAAPTATITGRVYASPDFSTTSSPITSPATVPAGSGCGVTFTFTGAATARVDAVWIHGTTMGTTTSTVASGIETRFLVPSPGESVEFTLTVTNAAGTVATNHFVVIGTN